jgi:hypothetical protein
MSSRPFIAPNTLIPIINNVSMATNIIGPATIIQMLPGISYDIAWTGVPVGTFQVQVSNTYSVANNGAVYNAGSWSTLPTSSFSGTYPVPAGSPGNGFLDVVGTEAYAVRLVYTAASGSGNLTVVAASKVL